MRPALAAILLALTPVVGLTADTPVTGGGGQNKLARKISAAIDHRLAADWASRGIKAAPVADDEEFCRRVYLDVIGRIPKVSEVRAFAADTDKDKRAKLVDTLMKKPGYSTRLAETIRAAWLPETISDQFKTFLGENYEGYLRRKLAAGVSLDAIVKETLTTDVQVGQRGRIAFTQNADPDQQALQFFYQALESKPENLGSMVTRALLGVKLECAQCHDHPFAPYSREQFWQFAAFFAEFTPLPPVGPNFVGPLEPQHTKNRLTIPGVVTKDGSAKQVSARFMDGTTPAWKPEKSPRQELADWIVSPKNPYFARNVVNRVWQQYFGVGLIDPIDEPGDGNPPSHPELLDDLAAGFLDAEFDLRILIQGITGSLAYQLTSRLTHPTQSDPRRFTRMNVKGLNGSQIFDSFVTATGVRTDGNMAATRLDPGGTGVSKFSYRSLFPIPQKPIETQTSILQALTVMNGRLVADQTSVENGEVLGAIADAPFLTTEKKVEALFLAALTRKPTDEEKEAFGSYVERGGPSGDKNKSLADVFWVLLNSTEFLFNH